MHIQSFDTRGVLFKMLPFLLFLITKYYVMKQQGTQPVKTRKQIADEYSISERTFRRWLKKAGIELPMRMLAPKEQEVIYDFFGAPNVSSADK